MKRGQETLNEGVGDDKGMGDTFNEGIDTFKVVSAEFYFHKPITVHLELYLFYCFIHFLLYIGQY